MVVKRGREEIKILAMEARRELDIKDDEHLHYDVDLYLENLGKEIIPIDNLKEDLEIDSFWTNGFEKLVIDKDCYESTNHRSRFTIAHEIGHLFLHQNYHETYSSVEEWQELILENSYVRNIFEQEANSFASNFLISDECLLKELNNLKEREEVKVYLENQVYTLEVISMMYSHILSAIFHVSQKAMEIRLENYWK